MRLVQNLPKEEFNLWEQMKFYYGALQKSLHEILDTNTIETYPFKIIQQEFLETRTITFLRHFESKYNEYKQLIKENPIYQQFHSETDLTKKEQLAAILVADFFKNIGIDYETELSKQWHQQGEKMGKLYAKLIEQDPSLFPDIIYVSPYLRTRLTIYYLLKEIEGLEIDFDKLINEDKLEDLIIGNFKGKKIAIKIDERIRERDHGSNIVPRFIREFKQEKDWYRKLLSKQQNEQVHYFTAPEGGESQVQTNARAKLFRQDILDNEEHHNILVVSHHLTIIWTLLSIFGGSFQTFYKLNELRRPANGSLTILSQIPKTEKGSENKFRIAGYNLSLEE